MLRYIGRSRALVRAADGHQGLVRSDVPLVGTTPQGGQAPVDLRLHPKGASFVPASAAVPVTLPPRGDGDLSFSRSGISVAIEGAAQQPGELLNDHVAVANVLTDSDAFWQAMPRGAELSLQLRSIRSPRDVTVRFGLQPGDTLRVVALHDAAGGIPGSAEVRRGGRLALVILPAVAVDAQGQGVHFAYSAAGNRLHMRLDEAAAPRRGIAWPVMLDPGIYEVWGQGNQDPCSPPIQYCSGNPDPWSWYSPSGNTWTPTDWNWALYTSGNQNAGSGIGSYANNSWAYWYHWADSNPQYGNSNIYIYQADQFNVSHTDYPQYAYAPAYTYVTGGILTSTAAQTPGVNGIAKTNLPPPSALGGSWASALYQDVQGDQNFNSYTGRFCATDNTCSPYQPGLAGGNFTMFEMFATTPYGTGYQIAIPQGAIGNEAIYESQTLPPTLGVSTSPGTSGNWVASYTPNVTLTGTDQGLGMGSVTLSGPGVSGPACTGTCTQSAPAWAHSGDIQYQTQSSGWTIQAPDGVSTYTASASDLVGLGATPQSFTAKVDSTPPVLNQTGALASADGTVIRSGNYDLSITADDSNSDGVATSGVQDVKVLVNGTQVLDSPQTCSPDCPQQVTVPWTFQAGIAGGQYPDGDYTIDVQATDGAGNQSTDTKQLSVAHTTVLASQQTTLGAAGGLQILGEHPGDQAGFSIANVGDVNGDGNADYLVGAPNATCGSNTASGAAYLVYGAPNQTTVNLADPTAPIVKFCGAQANDHAGYAVAAAGDINGDGSPDFLIGAPGPSDSTHVQGNVYAIFGGPNVQPLTLGANLGSEGFDIKGPLGELPALGTGQRFGAQIASVPPEEPKIAADINGDGKSDVIIGASDMNDNLRTNSGTTYVIFGKADTNQVDLSLGSAGASGFRIFGSAANSFAGQDGAHLGDVNGDGLSDIALTAPGAQPAGRTNAGTAYVVFGKSTTTDVDLAALGGQGYAIAGQSNDPLTNISPAGDVAGTGTPYLLVGAHNTYVVATKADNSTIDLAGTYPGYRVTAPSSTAANDLARPQYAGDLDGDNLADALISYPNASSGAGSTYAVYGQPGNQDLSLDTLSGDQGTRMDGPPGSHSGRSTTTSDQGAGDHSVVAGGAGNGSSDSGAVNSAPTANYAEVQAQTTRRNGCASSGFFTFPWGPSNALPSCRYTHYRSKDRNTQFNHGAARKVWPDLATRNPVTLYDSFGQMGTIQEKSTGCFTLTSSTTTYDTVDTSRGYTHCGGGTPPQMNVEVEGPGCTPGLDTTPYYRIILRERSRSLRPSGAGLVAFIRQTDGPPLTKPGGAGYNAAQRADAGCGSRGHGGAQANVPSGLSDHTAFTSSDTYLNRDQKPDYYATFNEPTGFSYELPVEISTSSTRVGGVPRGVAPVSQLFTQRDYMARQDNNVACGKSRLARWHYGRIGDSGSDLFAWIPTREPDGTRC